MTKDIGYSDNTLLDKRNKIFMTWFIKFGKAINPERLMNLCERYYILLTRCIPYTALIHRTYITYICEWMKPLTKIIDSVFFCCCQDFLFMVVNKNFLWPDSLCIFGQQNRIGKKNKIIHLNTHFLYMSQIFKFFQTSKNIL